MGSGSVSTGMDQYPETVAALFLRQSITDPRHLDCATWLHDGGGGITHPLKNFPGEVRVTRCGGSWSPLPGQGWVLGRAES